MFWKISSEIEKFRFGGVFAISEDFRPFLNEDRIDSVDFRIVKESQHKIVYPKPKIFVMLLWLKIMIRWSRDFDVL